MFSIADVHNATKIAYRANTNFDLYRIHNTVVLIDKFDNSVFLVTSPVIKQEGLIQDDFYAVEQNTKNFSSLQHVIEQRGQQLSELSGNLFDTFVKYVKNPTVSNMLEYNNLDWCTTLKRNTESDTISGTFAVYCCNLPVIKSKNVKRYRRQFTHIDYYLYINCPLLFSRIELNTIPGIVSKQEHANKMEQLENDRKSRWKIAFENANRERLDDEYDKWVINGEDDSYIHPLTSISDEMDILKNKVAQLEETLNKLSSVFSHKITARSDDDDYY